MKPSKTYSTNIENRQTILSLVCKKVPTFLQLAARKLM